MATASEFTISTATTTTPRLPPSLKNLAPFVYMVACNITTMILEIATVYLQYDNGGEEDGPVLIVNVHVQLQRCSSTRWRATVGGGHGVRRDHFCEQVHGAKLLGLGVGLATGLDAIVKYVLHAAVLRVANFIGLRFCRCMHRMVVWLLLVQFIYMHR
ncbi:unnamed protein product [Urochloa humidicola]